MEMQPPNQTSEIIFRDSFTKEELAYWGQFGIDETILDQFRVKPVLSFHIRPKNHSAFTIKGTLTNPVFAYEINKHCHKLYLPMAEKSRRFLWIGQKPDNHLFGLEQLPFTGELLFIAAGEKDRLTLVAQGYPAITLNSETATMPKEIAESLKARFKKIIVAYDLDETGIQNSQKLADAHGFSQLKLPSEMCAQSIGKDVSDFFKASLAEDAIDIFSQNRFEELISEATAIPSNDAAISPELAKLVAMVIDTSQRLKQAKSKPIAHPKPILTQLGNPILFRNTINVIQGKSGVHKSRLVEMMGSQFLMKNRNAQSLIGMEAD